MMLSKIQYDQFKLHRYKEITKIPKEGDDTIELTDKNFKKLVLQNDDMWLVKFFNPSCRPCKRLEPDWKIAASELKGRVNLGMIDITENPKLAHKYGIQEVPTIKYFSGSTFHAEEYTGGLTANTIVAWAMKRYIASIPIHSKVVEVTEPKVLDEYCEQK